MDGDDVHNTGCRYDIVGPGDLGASRKRQCARQRRPSESNDAWHFPLLFPLGRQINVK